MSPAAKNSGARLSRGRGLVSRGRGLVSRGRGRGLVSRGRGLVGRGRGLVSVIARKTIVMLDGFLIEP